MERIVILRGACIDSLDEQVLTKCLRIMFPGSEIQVRPARETDLPFDGRDPQQGHSRPDQRWTCMNKPQASE